MKWHRQLILSLCTVLLITGCSATPSWLTDKWQLTSYGDGSEETLGDLFAIGIGQRFYWEIHGDTITGYMLEGWDGTLQSIFESNATTIPDNFKQRTELTFKVTSSTSSECNIELIDGSELFPITSMVVPRAVSPGDTIIFRKLPGDMIAMDRKVDTNDNSIPNQAGMILMQRSSSLVNVDGDTYHRLVLRKAYDR